MLKIFLDEEPQKIEQEIAEGVEKLIEFQERIEQHDRLRLPILL